MQWTARRRWVRQSAVVVDSRRERGDRRLGARAGVCLPRAGPWVHHQSRYLDTVRRQGRERAVQGLRRVSNDISDRAPHRDLVQSPISAALGASLSRDRARLHRAAMAPTAWWLGLGSSLTIPSPCSYAPYGDHPVSPSTFGSKGSSDRVGAACRGALGSHSGQLTTAAGGGAVAVPTRTVCAAQFSSLARLAATRSNEADA